MNSNKLKVTLDDQKFQFTILWLGLIFISLLLFSSFFDFINLIYNDTQNLFIYILYFSLSIILGPIIGFSLRKYSSYGFILPIGGIILIICEIFRVLSITFLFIEFLLFFLLITDFNLFGKTQEKTEIFWNEPFLLIGLSIGLFLPSIIIDPNTFEQMYFIYSLGFILIIGINSCLLYIRLKNTDSRNQEEICKNEGILNSLTLRKSMVSLFKAVLILLFIIISAICAYILFYVVYSIVLRSIIFYSIFSSIIIDVFIIQNKYKESRRTLLYPISLNISLAFLTFIITILTGMGYFVCIYQIIISSLSLIILSIKVQPLETN